MKAPAPRARHRAPAGYTLIELVMTLALLVLSVPPLISLGSNCLGKLHQGAYVTTATLLAQEKLEQILADKACSTRGFAYVAAANYPAEPAIAAFPGYSRSVAVDADSTYNGTTFRNVSVTATAPDGTQATLSTWVIDQ